MSRKLSAAARSDTVGVRVPMDDDQFQACLEAARISEDLFVTRQLLNLALAYKNSLDEGWTWRMEDES